MTDPLTNVENLNVVENLAELTAGYHQALVAHGFERAEALDLTHTWLASIIAANGGEESNE